MASIKRGRANQKLTNEEPIALPETDDGTVLFNVPFPKDLAQLKAMAPIIIKQSYQIDYIHSYGQDSPFFAGLGDPGIVGACARDRAISVDNRSICFPAASKFIGASHCSNPLRIAGHSLSSIEYHAVSRLRPL